jgi:hypothetical protein
METVFKDLGDTRMPGVSGMTAGMVVLALAVLVVVHDLTVPGGNVYGSRGQGIVSMVFIGLALLFAGYMEYQGKA